MQTTALRILLIGSVLVGTALASAAAASEAQRLLDHQPEELVRRLFDQKVIVLQEVTPSDGPSDRYFVAYVVFETPVADAYRLLATTARHIEFRPEVTGMETVSRADGGNVDEHRLRVLFVNVTYRLQYRMEPERHRISWQLDPSFSNDLKHTEGYWEFYALEPERTLARFGSVVHIGDAMPRFFQDWVTRKNLPHTIERARRWVDSGGSWRP